MTDLFKQSVLLYRELALKKFKRSKINAFLSCFLNIGAIVMFLDAMETYAQENGYTLEEE